jgi:hypothetical protein
MQAYVIVPGSGDLNIVPKTADHHSAVPSGNSPSDRVDIPKMKRSMNPLTKISRQPPTIDLWDFIGRLGDRSRDWSQAVF